MEAWIDRAADALIEWSPTGNLPLDMLGLFAVCALASLCWGAASMRWRESRRG